MTRPAIIPKIPKANKGVPTDLSALRTLKPTIVLVIPFVKAQNEMMNGTKVTISIKLPENKARAKISVTIPPNKFQPCFSSALK